ncbi:hypothetical protein RFI_17692 [Reticulomyxa filosa]|uniref:Uncharacterized protein n=1 Tax=Reticulomyxa filosa TaxID=46433 RepID=X6N0V1_RETFI|nr:hypothetical protein RFI_17692 [Reticulomyxa filosa]|eukprot:ETO19538.1 hypothetical protein RFI_17692 [Reticulomyxa filosa]
MSKIEDLINDPENSTIHNWRCLSNHLQGGSCCKKFIEQKCARCGENYFAFVSLIGEPKQSILSESDLVRKESKFGDKRIGVRKIIFKFDLVIKYNSKYYAYPFVTSYKNLKQLQQHIEVDLISLLKEKNLFPSKTHPKAFSNKCYSSKQEEKKLQGINDDDKILKEANLPSIKFKSSSGQVEAIQK